MQRDEYQHPNKRGFSALAAATGMTADELTDAINRKFEQRYAGKLVEFGAGEEADFCMIRGYAVSTIRKYASPGFAGKPSDALLDVARDVVIDRIILDLAIAESIIIDGETRAERGMRRSREREIEQIRRLDEGQIDLEDVVEAAA